MEDTTISIGTENRWEVVEVMVVVVVVVPRDPV